MKLIDMIAGGAKYLRNRFSGARKLLAQSDLFDPLWYLDANPEVAATGMDPLHHYVAIGAAELRDPGPNFNAPWYASQNPGAAGNPLLHYLRVNGPIDQPVGPGPLDPWTVQSAIDNLEANPRVAAKVITASGFFEQAWYLQRNPDVAVNGGNPLQHYVVYGAAELREPGPRFFARWYAGCHAGDLLACRAPLLHYLLKGGSIGVDVGPSTDDTKIALETLAGVAGLDHDLAGLEDSIGPSTQDLETALETLAGVAGLDHDLAGLGDSIREGRLSWGGVVLHPATAAWRVMFETFEHSYDQIIFVPWLIRGGADLVAVNAARAAARNGSRSVLVVATDSTRMDARDWLPGQIDLRTISDYDAALTVDERADLVSWLIQALRPRSVLNVNSRACWQAFVSFGAGLSSFCELYAALFCRDYDAAGDAVGYADTHYRDASPHLKGIYLDNATFVEDLTRQFVLPARFRDRMRTIYQPVSEEKFRPPTEAGPDAPPRVLWASRLCRQKNVQLLVDIASQAPDLHFDVHGAGEANCEAIVDEASHSLPNLANHGAYRSFDALSLTEVRAFLYTSLWDGLPNVLLSAGAAGLPIVAPAVGGISELVDTDTGWLIEDVDDPSSYVVALREIHEDPQEAARRVRAMQKRLATRHSWSAYLEAMSAQPSFLMGKA